MKGVQRVDLGTLLQVTQALEAVVGPCFGPSGGQVLFASDNGEVLITRDGQRILGSLRLDHPVARVLVGCMSAHYEVTGDGTKSFLLLLGALLRGVRGERLGGGRACRALLSFQTLVLDEAIGQSLAPQAPPLLLRGATHHLCALMDAYLRGKVASSAHWEVLSRTACEFYRLWRCGPDGSGPRLISRHFAALHTTVPGLPISRTQVLPGLVVHGRFEPSRPGDGPLRALAAVSEPLRSSLAPARVTLSLASAAHVRRCCEGAGRAAEQSVAVLRRLGVGLLLSVAKQPETTLALLRREGVSVVEGMDADELAFFCRLAGAELYAGPGDWSLVGEEHVAVVTFCKPVVLGPDRLAHVGFPEGRGSAPHCLVVCGPSPGLTEQCTEAFRGLFRMLQRAFEHVPSHHSQGPVQSPVPQGPAQSPVPQGPVQSPVPQGPAQSSLPQGPVQSPLPQGPVQLPLPQGPVQLPLPPGPVQLPVPQGPVQLPHPQGPVQLPFPPSPVQLSVPQGPVQLPHPQGPVQSPLPQGPVQSPLPQSPAQSPVPQGPAQSPLPQGGEKDRQNAGHYLPKQPGLRNGARSDGAPANIADDTHQTVCTRDGGHLSRETAGPQDRGEGPQALFRGPNGDDGPLSLEPEHPALNRVGNGEAPGERLGVSYGKGNEEALGRVTRETGPASSAVLIEAGSVCLAGGAFEFLLHRDLLERAARSPCPDVRLACRLVAGAVLSVPRRLYPGRRFLEARLHFLGGCGAALPDQRAPGLESLACKYQLLLSVLHTLTSLLSVDLILHTRVSRPRDLSQEEDQEQDGN